LGEIARAFHFSKTQQGRRIKMQSDEKEHGTAHDKDPSNS